MFTRLDFSTDQDYFVSIGRRAIPIIAVGVICFLIFIFWGCCRCCGCCKVSATLSKGKKKIATILLVALLITASVFIFFGFAANTSQGDAFDNVVSAADDIVNWVSDVRK
jgi:protein tweety